MALLKTVMYDTTILIASYLIAFTGLMNLSSVISPVVALMLLAILLCFYWLFMSTYLTESAIHVISLEKQNKNNS